MPDTTVAAIITIRDNAQTKILLTRRNVEPFKGQWCLPGGHISKGESARDAVIREVKEETGLDFDAQLFSCFDEMVPEQNIYSVVTVFEGRGIGIIKTQADEVIETKWASVSDAQSLRLAFTHNEILSAYAGHIDARPKAGLLEEYSALRDEINQRIGSRDQLVTFSMVTAGTVLGLAVQAKVEPALLLAYPVWATLLAVAWAHHDIRIGQLGEYIRQEIESQLDMGWQEYIRNEYAKKENRFVKRLTEFSAAGIFLTTELLAVILAAYQSQMVFTGINFVLLLLDGVGFVVTLYLVQLRRARYGSQDSMRRASRILETPIAYLTRLVRHVN